MLVTMSDKELYRLSVIQAVIENNVYAAVMLPPSLILPNVSFSG